MMKKNESTGRGRTNGIYQVTKDECERCVRDALEVGYRSIDTAQSYFNEEEVGKAIEKSGIDRKEIFLTSKVWIEHFGYEECKKSVLESVEKLRTDYLDLMLLHQPFGDTYGAWRALEELYKEGKLHAIGISNHYTDRMVEFANFTNIKPMVNQMETHPLNQQKTLKEWADKYDIRLEAWAPFGEGRNGLFENEVLKTIGQKYGKTTAQVMLRWHIQRGVIVIPKSVHKETSVYKGYKQDKIEMRGDRAEMSDFPLYLNTVAGGLDRRDQTIGGFSFVVKIYAVPVVEIIG